MKHVTQGLNVGIERVNRTFYLSMSIAGKLTHEDYEIITPMIDSAVQEVNDPVINAFIDCSELEGWELHALWDDFKLGVKHHKKFNKIAILGNQKYLDFVSKVGSWFISGEIKTFETKDQALEWLC